MLHRKLKRKHSFYQIKPYTLADIFKETFVIILNSGFIEIPEGSTCIVKPFVTPFFIMATYNY
jgi:hypothetical protein